MPMIKIYGEIHSSKNSREIHRNRRTGKPYVAKSKAAKADESMITDQLAEQRVRWLEMVEGLEYPYWIMICFRRKTNARWDFINMVQGLADAMVAAGYIPDDDVNHFIPIYAGHEVNKNFPGVDFWIA